MINVNEFEKKTFAALLDSVNYSRRLLDRFDPDYNDIEGRKQCMAILNDIEDALHQLKN